MTCQQLDLFAPEAPSASDREHWASKFERAPWVAPYDCGLGPAGTVVDGWVCPACQKLEVNEFVLSINHGYDPSIPGRMAGVIGRFGETCTRLMLLAGQEGAAERRRASAAA